VKKLKPIKDRPIYWEGIEKALGELFKRDLYLPLLREIQVRGSVLNSYDDLISAISRGQIVYDKGKFTGKFSAAISKALKEQGATWDRSARAWKLSSARLTADMRIAIGASQARFEKAMAGLDKKLSDVVPDELAKKFTASKLVDSSIFKITKDVDESLKKITLEANYTPDQIKRIRAEYLENMQLYIKDWTSNEIKELRQRILDRVTKGERYEGVVDEIQKSYGVSQRKAEFLARQETSLLSVKIKQTRYVAAGIKNYEWRCVNMPHDKSVKQRTPGNVRYFHGKLDGTVQSWDNPPVVDQQGNRKHPGQDYNCRCTAVPIVEF
jgi:SPP1 gp7 family putative phage head morphogenesis protein